MQEFINKILVGKMQEKLKKLPADCLDSVVSDPPYGLSDEPNILLCLKDWLEKGYHEHKSKKGFMGKEWDSFVPQPNEFKEMYRVLKPGAYGLIACGTRTMDLMGISLRIAGFEIKDTITWHYGSGFPKSLNIENAVGAISAEQAKLFEGYGTALKPATEFFILIRKPIAAATIAKNV